MTNNERARKEATFDCILYDKMKELAAIRQNLEENSHEYERLTEVICSLGLEIMAMEGETIH